jgi:hypothetical protein
MDRGFLILWLSGGTQFRDYDRIPIAGGWNFSVNWTANLGRHDQRDSEKAQKQGEKKQRTLQKEIKPAKTK